MKAQVASAGTGKTTNLVARILARIGGGTPLRRIAAVTFTHVAAAQLRDRVHRAIDDLMREGVYLDGLYALEPPSEYRFEEARRELEGLTASTIHGFMIAGIRLVAPSLALRPDVSVIEEWEARAAFDEALGSLRFLARDDAHPLHDAFARLGPQTERLVMGLFGKRALTQRFVPDDDDSARAAVAVFDAAYERYLERLGPDMLGPAEVERAALRMVRTPGARARVVARYPVVLVDEYQDVNPTQGAFFEGLEAAGAEIDVVGDPKQSIYGFRHADVEVFRRALRLGERLPPLTETRRHGQVLTRFLNSLTATLAERSMGFTPDEAPAVEAVGPQAAVRGRVEVHWVAGERPIAELRAQEGRVLAERLRALHDERGHAFSDMAVVARSYASLREAELALTADGIPCVVLQGRGYYERQEVRDLVHALRVGVDPSGPSLAAWLRGPFAQLPLAEVERVVRADEPAEALLASSPEVAGRLGRIRGWVRGSPLEALKALIREPFIGGRRFPELLERQARDNVDALLLEVAARPTDDIGVLLERLALLARQAEAGEVPQAGDGVQLLTAHRSKGLEWPVVAVFDVGRRPWEPEEPLVLDRGTGRVLLAGSEGFAAARAVELARADQELFRLFYVAASRPRDTLVLTGSLKTGRQGGAEGWARALVAMGLGPTAGAWQREDFVLEVHAPERGRPPVAPTAAPGPVLESARWMDRMFDPHPLPPLQSPSSFTADHEPSDAAWRGPSGDGAAEALPGRGAAIGTLVHFAISRDWHPDDPRHAENLERQEVMFPFDAIARAEISREVRTLLGAYRTMLGTALPALDERVVDRPELPFAIRMGATVWQGVIDRLYRVGDDWWVDDYKTDRVVEPAKYLLQAAVYRRAVLEVLGVTPAVRLVYLRNRVVVPLGDAELEGALDAAAGAG